MKSEEAERPKLFLNTLKFQHVISPVFLALAVLVLTAVLSLQAGTSVATVEAAASALVCPVDMISYWTLDESSGETFADSVLTNDATCSGSNCPTSTTGRVNLARTFNGSNQRLTVPHDASLNWTGNPSFSIELWVRVPSQTCSSTPGEVFIGKYASSGARWWLGCGRPAGPQNRATFFLRDSAGTELTLSGSPNFDDNNWHHLVAVRDAAANTTRLYIDGTQAASSGQSFNGNFANTGDLAIGYFDTTLPASYANATIDEIALYNSALTPAEITDHYNSGLGKAYCTEAVAPEIDAIPPQTAVVGQLFTYDVNASGDPAPTFSLDEPPDGMTIDEDTGVITWTPDATGNFNVTVVASNIAGDDEEIFTITVGIPPVIAAIDDQTAVVGQLFTYDVDASGVPAPTFSLDVAPAEMEIDPDTGEIEWTPDAVGDVNVTVRATNAAGSDTEEFTITVNSLPVIAAIDDQTAIAGDPFTYDVDASGVPAPTFSLDVAPVGMDIDPDTGEIAWTPPAAGVFDVTVRATNAAGFDTEEFTIAVSARPSITPIPDQGGVVGQPFAYTVAATGDPAPTFSLDEPPAGMTIDPDSGLIEWTPTANGLFEVTVVATNDVGTDTAIFTIEVTAAPVIATIFDQTAAVGVLFTYDVQASGDPAPTFSLAAGSPDGMTIHPDTGLIEWTPDAVGDYEVTVVATNEVDTDTETFIITVGILPVIATIPNQTGVAGDPFAYDVEATGDPAPVFSLVAAPPGMTIHPDTGVISWTPAIAGAFDVIVEATNLAGSDTEAFTITVNSIPVISPIPNQAAVAGQLFTYDVDASGSPAPTFSLAAGSPAGMTIDANSGVINWTPATTGAANVTVIATNVVGSDSEDFTITVNSLPVITAIPNQTALAGELFTYDVEASGVPAPTFSLLVSPAGMTINPTTGVITWTPAAAGNANVSVRAQNAAGSAIANFTINVAAIGEEGHFLYLPTIIRAP